MENHLPSTIDTANSTTGKIEAGLMRIAIQPALGVKLGPVTIAASARLGSIQYNNIAGSLIYKNQNQVDYLTSNKSLFVAEPALTARFGTPMLQIQAQAGTSFNLTNSAFLQNTNYVSLGVVIKLEGAKN